MGGLALVGNGDFPIRLGPEDARHLLLAATGLLVGAAAGGYSTTLGIFFWFQITDFDRFLGLFSLCHFIFPSYLLGLFSRCIVSVTPKGN